MHQLRFMTPLDWRGKHISIPYRTVNMMGKELIEKLPNQWKYAQNYTRLLRIN
jgi:hypothetical protein